MQAFTETKSSSRPSISHLGLKTAKNEEVDSLHALAIKFVEQKFFFLIIPLK